MICIFSDGVSTKMQQNNVFTVAKRTLEGQDMVYQSIKFTNNIWALAELKIQPGNPTITVSYSPGTMILHDPKGNAKILLFPRIAAGSQVPCSGCLRWHLQGLQRHPTQLKRCEKNKKEEKNIMLAFRLCLHYCSMLFNCCTTS